MSELTEFRESKDHFMGHDSQSPLTDDQKRGFSGLKYYDENSALSLVITPEKFDNQEVIEMQTSTGDVAQYVRWGKISFEVESQPAQLTVYKDADSGEFFLPFADATSSSETYGAGRYLEVEALPNGQLHVEFNYAYNPYCAYNERWSCPLTPLENRIQVPIRAGEKNFK
ncbi:MAG: DUF1684 domain-containing protein [Chloroflexi bacterium]|nr:DUF1684 domain-containing protein [Chloroflexota bacterium]